VHPFPTRLTANELNEPFELKRLEERRKFQHHATPLVLSPAPAQRPRVIMREDITRYSG
jgi:hypothetical protein